MKTFILNLKIKSKVLVWYSVMSVLLLLVGFKFHSLQIASREKNREVISIIKFNATLIKAKYFIRAEVQTAVSLVNSESNKQTTDWWNEHLSCNKSFDEVFYLLKEFSVQATDIEYEAQKNQISKTISEIDETYLKVIVPSFEKIYQLKTDKLDQATAETQTLDTIQSLDAIMKMDLDLSTGQQSAKEAVIAEMKQLLTYIDVTGLEIIKKLDETSKSTEVLQAEIELNSEKSNSNSQILTIIILLLIFAIIITISFYIAQLSSKLITKLDEVVIQLSQGELPTNFEITTTDEIGEMSSSLMKLTDGLRRTAEFSIEIGKENFGSEYKPLGENDVLGNSLLAMRKNLYEAKNAEQNRKLEDVRRNWATEGLAKFGEILRHSENIQELSDNIISNIIKYLNANQGGIFIYQDNKNEGYLELMASFAYNRKKFNNKKIRPGEGLIGSCWIEKYTILLTDIPDEYIEIESGLGTSNPNCLLIVPLKTENNILGVMEIASFKQFMPHEIELIEKIAESIASSLQSLKINDRTSELLLQSQNQTEEMHKQDELMKQRIETLKNAQLESDKKEAELRKNIEDLIKAQSSHNKKEQEQKNNYQQLSEELKNKQHQLLAIEKHNKLVLETCFDGAIMIDSEGNFLFTNEAALQIFQYEITELIGQNISKVIPLENILAADVSKQTSLEVKLKSIIGLGQEVSFLRKNGTEGSLFISFLENTIGGKTTYTGIFKDHSELKFIEASRNELMETMLETEQKYKARIDQLEANFFSSSRENSGVDFVENDLIRWSTELTLDIESIDAQHKSWVQHANQLYKAIGIGDNSAEILKALDELIKNSKNHFSYEERYFEEFNYNKMISHSFEHQSFLDKLLDFHKDLKNGKTAIPSHFLLLLKSWILQHILLGDTEYVKIFKENGVK